MRNAYNFFVREPKGKRQLEKSGHKWKVNIEINFEEMRLRT
jgi:hypothetical protein